MPRSKGTPKTGGRKKGTPNRLDGVTRENLSELAASNMPKLKRELDALDGKDYVLAMLKIFEYVLPKLSAVELNGEVAKKTPQDDLERWAALIKK